MASTRFTMKPILDQHSLLALIKQCSKIRDLKTIQAFMVRANLIQETFLTSKLIESSALSLLGQVENAHRIFSLIHKPNLFMWNTLIRAYSIAENTSPAALTMYSDMHHRGISSNSYTLGFVLKACGKLLRVEEGKMVHNLILKMGFEFELPLINGLINFYVACDYMLDSRKVFDEMPVRDGASWSTMISAYAQNGEGKEALELFRQLQVKGAKIDEYTLATIVGVCGDMGALDLGKWVHDYVERERVKMDIVLGTSLVGMYSKCGSMEDAEELFEGMSERDITTWSTMVGGYAINGYGKKSLQVFEDMKKAHVKPNSLTFTSVLSACSHAGLVDEGRQHFDSMIVEYGIDPKIEHYGCMVDLFCRGGLVPQAYAFMQQMPIEPNVVLWRTLLTACKTHGYKDLGGKLSREILKLEPDSGENYVLASNVYASLGNWSSVSKIRSLMEDKKALKRHGWSSIEVNSVVHQFVMGDEMHPESKEIYEMLEQIARKLKQEGHMAITTDVLHDIDEEEKEHALGLHSERLAIAYGLLHLSKDAPIRIVKNLRVCRDCHSAMKLLSAAYGREIIVRDRVRFHHFRGGKCSCSDYW